MTYDLILKHDLRFVLTTHQRSILALLCFASVCLLGTAHAQNGWTTPRLLNPALQTQTIPYIVVGPNNEITIVCSDFPGGIGLYRSTNGGSDFVRRQGPSPNTTDFYTQWLALSYDRQGNLLLLWKWAQQNFPYLETMSLSKSTDSGTSFSTLWTRQRNWFRLREYPFVVDANNTIHMIWDSTTVSGGFDFRYLRFVNGNPANTITRVVPRPDATSTREMSMLVDGDSLHIALQRGDGSVTVGYYARSTNGGLSFSPYVVVDSFFASSSLVRTTRGKAIFYGRFQGSSLTGVPVLKFISDSGAVLSDPLILPTKEKALPFIEGGGVVTELHPLSGTQKVVS